MLDFITKKISNKIIAAMFVLMSISSIAVIYSTVTKVKSNSIETTKAKDLEDAYLKIVGGHVDKKALLAWR